jgi:hypothetical protein
LGGTDTLTVTDTLNGSLTGPASGLRAGTDNRPLVPQAAPLKEILIMWPTLLTLWRTLSRKAPRKGGPRRRLACRRLCLEALEDRAVPASLSYSTYLSSPVEAVAVRPGDTTGNVYVASGGSVLELNNGGTGLVSSTNVGGTLYGLAVDTAGNAYVIGNGGGVPTTANAIAASSSGNMFVAELNPTGGVVYATYLPGAVGYISALGFVGAIAVDGSGNIYVTGAALGGLPVTAGAFQTAYGSSTNAFFAKINPALSGSASLVYATYLGGSGSAFGDAGTGIGLDGSGNAYVIGYTHSTNFPTTSGAFQTSFVGTEDAFVAKFNPSLSGGQSLVYSSLLGGSGIVSGTGNTGYVPDIPAIDAGNQIDGGIAVDSAGNAYVTATTTSLSFPTTPGAFQTQSNLNQTSGSGNPAPSDAFVTKLNPTGTALVYSTYLGGGANTSSGGAGIALDANGDAYVAGWTSSTVFPTKNPIQATNAGGGYDAFVTVLNLSGNGLLFSSYLGGTSIAAGYAHKWDHGYGIALDSAGNAYLGGRTLSSNFPTTPGAYQTSGIGFVCKINAASPSFGVTGFPSPTTAGASGTFTVTAQDANGNTLTSYTGTIHFTSSDPQAVLPADYTFTAADQGVHTFSATLKTAGSKSVVATDTVTSSMSGQEGIQVNPAAAAQFVLSGPSSITAGTAFSLTVTALDAYGNTATGYTGTVHFTDSVSGATLPGNYTFTAADHGVHTFTRLKLRTKGMQTITLTDTLDHSIVGILTIDVI